MQRGGTRLSPSIFSGQDWDSNGKLNSRGAVDDRGSAAAGAFRLATEAPCAQRQGRIATYLGPGLTQGASNILQRDMAWTPLWCGGLPYRELTSRKVAPDCRPF